MNDAELSNAELDEAIAKAKGWTSLHGRMDFGSIHDSNFWEKPGGIVTSFLPDWSTGIADAWGLIEELAENWTITIENRPDNPQEVLVRIFRAFSNIHFMGDAPTAPRAICIAWLAVHADSGRAA